MRDSLHRPQTGKWLTVVLAILVLSVLWFINLDSRPLIKPDEGRYAEIPREMVVTGDWITPRLNGLKYFEKPVWQYWVTAAAYTVFGEAPWTARLWTGLTGLLGILGTGWFASRLYGIRVGYLAAAALSGSLLWVMMGQVLTLDMGVSFLLNAAVFALILGQQESRLAQQRLWMLLAWAMLALAVLSKGLIGLVLPGGALVVYSLWYRDWHIWRRMYWLPGLCLFALITVPWFVLVSQANPEFPHFFFVREHFQRFLTKEHGRYQPFWYFIPVLLVGALPWSIHLWSALVRYWRELPKAGTHGFSAGHFLLTWVVLVFAFFSYSSSKLVPYILPIFPGLAVMLGAYLAHHSHPRRLIAGVLPLIVGLLTLVWWLPSVLKFTNAANPRELLAMFIPYVQAGLLVMVATMLVGSWLWWKRCSVLAALVISLGGLIGVQVAMYGAQALMPLHSAERMVNALPAEAAEVPFYTVGTYDQTLPFYLKRTVMLVAYEDEFKFGGEQEPGRILTQAEFVQHWQQQPQAFALMTQEIYQRYLSQNLPMESVFAEYGQVVVRKPAQP